MEGKLALDNATERLMAEFFKDKQCCKCRRTANRLHQGHYYCFECFDRRYRKKYIIPKVKDHNHDRI